MNECNLSGTPTTFSLVEARKPVSFWDNFFGRLIRLPINVIFFCWHWKMSRPFTREGQTYCVCLRCGMRQSFDLKTWKSKGPYYRASERMRPSIAKAKAKTQDHTFRIHIACRSSK
jgi:hypothetical protein